MDLPKAWAKGGQLTLASLSVQIHGTATGIMAGQEQGHAASTAAQKLQAVLQGHGLFLTAPQKNKHSMV
jgi:hypothetical protein